MLWKDLQIETRIKVPLCHNKLAQLLLNAVNSELQYKWLVTWEYLLLQYTRELNTFRDGVF